MRSANNSTPSLTFKYRKKRPLHRLPFVGPVEGRREYSFWNVPQSGEYAGGCETGQALAQIYLKHLREHGTAPGGTLQNIVLDMFGTEEADCERLSSLRGQAVGFFYVLDYFLEAAAKYLGKQLDSVDNTELLKIANAGLNFSDDSKRAIEAKFQGDEA